MKPEETIKAANSQKPKAPNIHKMKLHEKICVEADLCIYRVPGGWIYEGVGSDAVFVPYSNEFFCEQAAGD